MAFDFKNNLSNLMQEAQKMQEKLQQAQSDLAKMTVEGVAGGGAVRVTMNGKHEVLKVEIDKSLEEEGLDIIGDLTAGAFNNASKKVEEASKNHIQKLTQGIQMPAQLQDEDED